ncbi:acyltransferase family protein [Brevundimonas sp.]|uniref:acyltransferase family protein n=1 Tax=Brevundimonas sp. TaxID=1871086 RepID=UPI002FDB4856
MSEKSKLMQLESARGIAALIVVLYHFHSTSPLTANLFVLRSYPVDFFFVLSGFVIALNYGGMRTWAEAVAFIRRRFWRLYPLHLALLLAYVAFETLQWLIEQRTGQVGEVAAFTLNGPVAVIAHATLTQAILLPDLTLNVPAWSISTEFWAYVIFALAVLIRHRALLVVGVISAAMVLVLDGGGLSATGAPGAIFRCLYSFMIGVGACAVFDKVRVPRAGWIAIGAFAVATVLSIGGWAVMLIPFAFAALVIALAKSSGGPLLWSPLTWIGTRSYSVYMVHFLAWQLATLALRKIGLDPMQMPTWQSTLVVLAMVGVVLGVSALTYAWIERPFMQRGARRLNA